MKTVKASTSPTPRKPMTKSQRVRVLDDTLNAIYTELRNSMEELLDVRMSYEDEWTVLEVLENHLRTQVDEQKGSAEFLQLGRMFVELDDLLHGPEIRQARLEARRAEAKLWEAKHGVKLRKRTAKLKAA